MVTLITSLGELVSRSFSVMIGIGLAVFLFGLVKFILNKASEGEAEEWKNLMVWGLVALFVMVSVRGIIVVMQGLFGIFDTDL